MLAFELAVAMVAMATAPHHTSPAQSRPTASRAAPRATGAPKHAAACSRAHKGYDARTDTYRNARGKRQRCTL